MRIQQYRMLRVLNVFSSFVLHRKGIDQWRIMVFSTLGLDNLRA